jgi:uncharacterized membrane protein
MFGTAAGLGIAAAGIGVKALTSALEKRRASGGDESTTGFNLPGAVTVVGRSVTIHKPRAELFAYWRDFANFAAFMDEVEQVRPANVEGRTVWTMKARAQAPVGIQTEVVAEVPNELIAWRSVEGSSVRIEGRVEFADAPGERGTRVSFVTGNGSTGAQTKSDMRALHDLKRFKMLMETGEIATSNRRATEKASVAAGISA